MTNDWQGQRINLRGIEPSDGAIFFRWNQDGERARFLDFAWPPISRAAVDAWAEEQSRHRLQNDTFHWVIENKTGDAVGSISTHDCNPRNGTFSYGIDIDPAYRRMGFASEAIRMVCQYYFSELRYQKASVPVHGDNQASIALHEGLGFQREGILRRMIYSRGCYVDEWWFGLTREEFEGAPGV